MGSSFPAESFSTSKLQPQKRTLVITGDSWVVGEIHATPSDSAAKGIIRNLNAQLGIYFDIVNIAGVGGERLDQIRARHAADVLAYSPGYHVLIGGANDASQMQSAGRTAALMFADTKAMIDTDIDAGIIPIIFPSQLTQGGFVSTAASAAEVQARIDMVTEYNRLLSEYLMTKAGWIYVSKAWEGIIDHEYNAGAFAVNTPAILSQYQLDVGHIDHAGAYRVAKSVKAQIADKLGTPDVLPYHYNDKAAACHNPMQKATGTPSTAGIIGTSAGTVTNAPAEGWMARLRNEDATAACTITQIARTDIEGGYWNSCACTVMDANSEIELRESETTAFGYDYIVFADKGFSTGDVIEFYFECRLYGISGSAVATGEVNNLHLTTVIVEASTVSRATIQTNRSSGSTSLPYIGTDFDSNTIMVFSSERYTIVDDTDKFFSYAVCGCQSTATGTSAFTFDLGRIGMRKVG